MRGPYSVKNSRNLEKGYSQKTEYVQMAVTKYYSLDLFVPPKRCVENNVFQNKNKKSPDKGLLRKGLIALM